MTSCCGQNGINRAEQRQSLHPLDGQELSRRFHHCGCRGGDSGAGGAQGVAKGCFRTFEVSWQYLALALVHNTVETKESHAQPHAVSDVGGDVRQIRFCDSQVFLRIGGRVGEGVCRFLAIVEMQLGAPQHCVEGLSITGLSALLQIINNPKQPSEADQFPVASVGLLSWKKSAGCCSPGNDLLHKKKVLVCDHTHTVHTHGRH